MRFLSGRREVQIQIPSTLHRLRTLSSTRQERQMLKVQPEGGVKTVPILYGFTTCLDELLPEPQHLQALS